MASGKWRGTLQDMRNIRLELRRLASGMGDTERNTLRHSDIDRLESGITKDMIYLLQRNANSYRADADKFRQAGEMDKAREALQKAANFDRSIQAFQNADRFTRQSAQQMEYIERLFDVKNAEGLYRNVMNAALSKGRGDLEKLRILSQVLRPDEMSDFAAGVIRQLGEPIGSARGMVERVGFSPTSALTCWNNMTPEARTLIFGQEHAQALDDWFRVVRRLANVEAMANRSESGNYITNAIVGLFGAGLALHGHAVVLGGLLGLAGGMSILLSRPSYVRWVTQYAKLRADALRLPVNVTAPRMAVLVNQLNRMAIKDPNLIPIQRIVAAENGVRQSVPEDDKKKHAPRP
jgi:hypothetical protein